jgi:hypothetical protein
MSATVGPSTRHIEPLLPSDSLTTHTVDAVVQTQNVTKTCTVDAVLIDTTLIKRYECGRITDDTCVATSRFSATSGSVTISSGEALIAASDTADYHVKRTVLDDTSLGSRDLTVNDAVVCVDLHNVGANNGTAGNIALWSDASNYYVLEVASGAAGTSRISTKIAGVKTSRLTVTKGIASAATKRVKLSRIGNMLSGVVDGTEFSSYTDTASRGSLNVYFGAPNNGAGTSDVRLDNLCVCVSDNIEVRDVPTGGSVRVYDASDTVVAQATETLGIASLDLSAQQFPFTGYIKVFTDSYTTLASKGRFPSSGNNSDICGGDIYRYNKLSEAGGWGVIGTDFAPQYATSQVNAHNGAVTNGDFAYGVAQGRDGKIYSWKYRRSTGDSYTYELAPRGTIVDQHMQCEMVADSSGYLHVVYGGGTVAGVSQATYYTKSTAPYNIENWTTPTNVANGLDCGLIVDQADVLHLIGVRSVLRVNDAIVYYKNTGAGWSAETRIANAATFNWRVFIGDTCLGQEPSGQKSIHLSGFSYKYSGGSGTNADYKDCWYVRTTDAGSTFKGLTGASYTLPLAQDNTTGVITGIDRIYTGTGAYVSRIGADVSGTGGSTIHAAMYDLAVSYPRYFKGVSGTGWTDMAVNFSSANTHGAFANLSSGDTAYIGARVDIPEKVVRYRSTDTGATWTTVETMIDSDDTGYPPEWYWLKLTPIVGSTNVTAIWQSRYTAYRSTTPWDGVTGEGSASLFIADVSAVPVATTTVDGVVAARRTKTHTVDAVVQAASSTGTHTVDAVVLKTATKTHTADAVITGGSLVTHTVDGLVAAATPGVHALVIVSDAAKYPLTLSDSRTYTVTLSDAIGTP